MHIWTAVETTAMCLQCPVSSTRSLSTVTYWRPPSMNHTSLCTHRYTSTITTHVVNYMYQLNALIIYLLIWRTENNTRKMIFSTVFFNFCFITNIYINRYTNIVRLWSEITLWYDLKVKLTIDTHPFPSGAFSTRFCNSEIKLLIIKPRHSSVLSWNESTYVNFVLCY